MNSAAKPQCGTTLRVVNRDAERRSTILQKNMAFGDNDVGRDFLASVMVV